MCVCLAQQESFSSVSAIVHLAHDVVCSDSRHGMQHAWLKKTSSVHLNSHGSGPCCFINGLAIGSSGKPSEADGRSSGSGATRPTDGGGSSADSGCAGPHRRTGFWCAQPRCDREASDVQRRRRPKRPTSRNAFVSMEFHFPQLPRRVRPGCEDPAVVDKTTMTKVGRRLS